MLNTQPQHPEDNQVPKVTRAFKAPTFGITDEMVQESIEKFQQLSKEAVEVVNKIQREQEEEIEKREKSRFKNGDLILKYEGKWHNWSSHPYGIIIKIGNKFYLKGEKDGKIIDRLIYEGKLDDWLSYSDGIIIQIGNKFYLKGEKDGEIIDKLLYEGEWNGWHPHPDGIIIQNGNEWRIYTGEIEEKNQKTLLNTIKEKLNNLIQ